MLAGMTPPGSGEDSLRLAEREARSAARRYENAIIQTASQRFGGRLGDRCDERIGRYCFWYSRPGTPRRPIEPEPPEVAAARGSAIHAFRRWYALAPDNERAVAPLLRYLVEAERASEAVAAARAHVWAGGADPESLLFLGLALHYDRDFQAAEAAFDSARALATAEERRRLDDVEVLLDRSERSHYRSLTDHEKEAYEARFWALADAWLMDAGNERRSAHYARHAWSRILAMAPRVQGRLRWGRDDHEILIRYGLATGRQRQIFSSASITPDMSLVEWFDPRRIALAAGDLLTEGLPHTPPPGVRPEIERDTARSHYAPLGLRRTRGLVTAATVFPGTGGGEIRIDALLLPDTVDPRVPVHPRGLLVILDTLGNEIGRAPVRTASAQDSLTILTASYSAPPGTYLYRMEVRDDSTQLGGLAQYRVDIPVANGLTVSDLLVAWPESNEVPESRYDPDIAGIPRLIFRPNDDLAVYAEVSGLAVPETGASTLDVQWWIEYADGTGLLRRAARWLGERIGLAEARPPVRVSWREPGAEETHGLFVTLTLPDLGPGLHELGLRVRDGFTGAEATSSRLILVDPQAPPLPRPAGM